MAQEARFRSFEEFWPFYLREHSKAITRGFHYVGTSLFLAIVLYVAVSGRFVLLPLALVAGYFFAWLAHFTVEKNRPATFTYPVWSFIADFRMYGLWLTGRLGPELEKAGIPASTEPS